MSLVGSLSRGEFMSHLSYSHSWGGLRRFVFRKLWEDTFHSHHLGPTSDLSSTYLLHFPTHPALSQGADGSRCCHIAECLVGESCLKVCWSSLHCFQNCSHHVFSQPLNSPEGCVIIPILWMRRLKAPSAPRFPKCPLSHSICLHH